jgi:hypothetical protein
MDAAGKESIMGRVRVCGKICHRARKPKCKCWCAGLFHGDNAKGAREAFAHEFGEDPKGERPETLHWNEAMRKARETRPEVRS